MKTIKTLLLTIIALTIITTTSWASTNHTSGNSVTKELNGVAFQYLEINSFFTVKLTQGKQYKVKITVSERFEPYLISEIKNNKLFIAIRTHNERFNEKKNDIAMVEISAPSFKEIVLSGAVNMALEGNWEQESAMLALSGATKLTANHMKIKSLKIEQSGASHIDAKLTVDELTVDNSGASHLTLKSLYNKTGKVANIDVSGASHVNLGKYSFNKITVDASGASHTKVFPVQQLKAEASGASYISYIDSSKSLQKKLRKSGIASIDED